MVQGGDPLGTGKGGESIWGGPFPDEFHPDNKHDRRGVVRATVYMREIDGTARDRDETYVAPALLVVKCVLWTD